MRMRFLLVFLIALPCFADSSSTTQVPLVFSGGHETDPRDHGRPVVLVAGALKAHKRADLIGQTTYGKNLVQKMVPISQAPYGALRVSWSQFHLPKTDDGAKISVSPTIPTTAGEELNIALERARPLIAMMMR